MKYILLSLGLCLSLTACNGINNAAPPSDGGGDQKVTSRHVNLAWGATPGAQQGFYIEQSVDGANFAQVMTVPDGTTTASLLVLASGTYYFRIRSFNSVGVSPYTPVVVARL
jgi:hypothetical protein